MSPLRLSDRLILFGLLALAALALGWLLLGLYGDQSGRQALPDERGSMVGFLPTGSTTLTDQEVAALPEESWRSWSGRGFAPSPRGEAIWVRVKLRNPGPVALHGILADTNFYSDRVDFFAPKPGGAAHQLRSGEWTPSREKALWGRETAFPVTIPAGETETVYLRYKDYFGIWLELEWWPDQSAFHAARLRATLADGLYFGTLLALLFYNAVLWARLRFPDTGYYLGYLGLFTAHLFLARGELPLLGGMLGSPWLEIIAMVTLASSGAFLAQFIRVFLELPLRLPKADRVARTVKAVMLLLILGALGTPWIHDESWLSYLVLGSAVGHLVLMGVAVAAWRAGAREARFFVLAFGLLLAGLLPAVASWLDFVRLSNVVMAAMLGSAMEMLLLSVAMAYRFAKLQRDKITAQQGLLAEAQRREVMQEAYADELALEVRERTRELEAANVDKDRIITVLGHDLRGPLTGLTQTAEQLATVPAGASLETFAAEAARTGRELLLMIEDLVLWARLRAGAGQVAAHSARALVAPAVELYRIPAVRCGVELVVEIPGTLRVEADLVPAQTLVRNLLANALKVARCRVVVSAVTTSEGVRFSVRDDGPGLPKAVASRLSSESLAPLAPESGLGLRLCVEISWAMGTRLEAISLPGGGTELCFILPIAKVALLERNRHDG